MILVAVAFAAGHAGITPQDSVDDNMVGYLNFDHRIQRNPFLVQHVFQNFSLFQSPRKTVEDKAFLAVRLLNPVGNHLDHQFIGGKTAGGQMIFQLVTDFSPLFDFFPQHLAGRKMANAVPALKNAGLCSFSGSRRAGHYQMQSFSVLKTHYLLFPFLLTRAAFFKSPSY